MKKSLLLIILFSLFSHVSFCQKTKHTFALADSSFLLDNKPFHIISGEMHYTRVPREYWRARMRMARAMGLNTIATCVFWNAHQPEQGKFDFSGNNDIAEFVRMAKAEGLYVILRPSPYTCAEWEFGGYPWWLLKNQSLKVRTKDPAFLKAYRDYIMQLGKQVSPLLVTHGGNILLVQIENEYGHFGNDKEYLNINREIYREAGIDGLLYTCDAIFKTPDGYLPGLLPAVNGIDDTQDKIKEMIKTHHDGKGPFLISEWYPGWFDNWGAPHRVHDGKDDAKKLDQTLKAGMSINFYMFHGGTTFGFMSGADYPPYLPHITSYDYNAPLDESGHPTPKFFEFKSVIEKYLPAGTHLPPIPSIKKPISIKKIRLTESASLLQNLKSPILSVHPMTFEDINQGYGFVMYTTTIKKPVEGLLKIKELRDFGTVYLNGQRVAVLDRRLKQDSLMITTLAANTTISILVENGGRIAFGRFLNDNKQGITEKVTLNGEELIGWKMYRFPFKDSSGLKFKPNEQNESQKPMVFKGKFSLNTIGDTFLDMRNFGKGFVSVNGHNLGRYWYIGPQQTLYLPGCWLKKGKNTIVVFDELKGKHALISALDHPILDQVISE